MRGNSASKQLVLITILTLVLVICVGVLIFLQVISANKAMPVMSIAPNSESVSSESKPQEDIAVPSSSLESSEMSQSIEPSSKASSSSLESAPCPPPVPPAAAPPIIYYVPYVPPAPPAPPAPPTFESLSFTEDGEYSDYQVADYGYIYRGDIIIRNKTFNEDVTILKGASLDSISFENVIINGNLIIEGGSTVNFTNTTVNQIIVENKTLCDLFLIGNTTVAGLTAKSPVNVDEYELGKNYDGVENMTIESGSYIWQNIFLSSTHLNTLFVNDIANISIDGNSVVKELTAGKKTHLKGRGYVDVLYVECDDVTYEREPNYIKMNDYYAYPQRSDWDIGL